MHNSQPIEYRKLGDLSSNNFQNGLYKPSSEYGQGTEIVRINDYCNDGVLNTENLKMVTLSSTERSSFALELNDIVINRVNSLSHIGKCCLIGALDAPLVFESNMMRLRILDRDLVIPEFVAYVMRTPRSRDYLRKVAKPAVAQASINQDDIKSLKIPYFPKREQKQIVEVFSTWDRAIEKTEALIKAKERRKAGLMQRLLTGKVRFGEFAGEEWETYRLGDLFKQRNERGRGDLPLVSITMAGGVVSRNGVNKKDTSNDDKSKYLRICPGDIGYNTMRMWQGVSGVSEIEGIVSPAYTICIPGPKADAQFAKHLFKSQVIIHKFYRHSQGMVSDTWNLKFKHFSEIKVAIPSVSEQAKIAKVLNAAVAEIEEHRNQLAALKEQKKGLMQQLLTGKVRVSAKESSEIKKGR
jgi:type I restriction enzyme S subunit